MQEELKEAPKDYVAEVRVLRMKHLVDKVGLSKCTIYKKMKIGLFPQSFPLTGKAVGWREDEVNEWIENQQGN